MGLLVLVMFINAQGQQKESGGLFPVSQKGKGGYINGAGKIIIPLGV